VAAVYAAALALMSLPFREFKAWGHAAFMHSITSIGLLAVIPALVAVRGLIAPYVEPYIGVDISAGPETALAHITQYRLMVFEWINAVNLSAEALGAIQGVMMLALTPLLLSGVGVLFASIASYLFSAVFGLLIFAQRFLSLLYLFSEVVRVFMALAPILGPGMFTAGLILYAVPFGRRLGKTLIVFGAALTLVLPPAIVAALPSPAGGGGRDPEDQGDTGVQHSPRQHQADKRGHQDKRLRQERDDNPRRSARRGQLGGGRGGERDNKAETQPGRVP
jgi:hypothetical protein